MKVKPEMRGRRNRIKYFLLDVTKSLFDAGRGRSKHADMQESYERYETRETTAIYSYSTFNRYQTVMAKFADYLRDEMNVKYERDFRRLSEDEVYYCIDQFFQKEVESGLAQNTLEIHISAIHKVIGEIKPGIREYFTAEARERWRDGVPAGDNDRYNNPEKIIENLRKIDETSYLIAELQRLTGSRVGDVKKIELDEKDQKVIIKGSKGGRDRYIHYDRFEEDFEKVKEYKEKLDRILEEKKFSEIREDKYYDDLRRACRKAQEPYRASHPFRYEFAQSRYEEIKEWDKQDQIEYYRRILEERNKSEKEIKEAMESVIKRDVVDVAIVSEELGHSRIDISMHYLKLKGK
jgi:hypothetical protein